MKVPFEKLPRRLLRARRWRVVESWDDSFHSSMGWSHAKLVCYEQSFRGHALLLSRIMKRELCFEDCPEHSLRKWVVEAEDGCRFVFSRDCD